MSEIIGVFSLDDSFNEHMSLTLYPDSFAVRWSLCNLTANFMAEYFGELFPETDQEERLISREEVSGAVSYILNELVENRTTLIIAHRIQSVMIADLILVLDKGEVIQMGTHEELVSQMDGMYRRIYDIQTRIDEELEMEISRVN